MEYPFLQQIWPQNISVLAIHNKKYKSRDFVKEKSQRGSRKRGSSKYLLIFAQILYEKTISIKNRGLTTNPCIHHWIISLREGDLWRMSKFISAFSLFFMLKSNPIYTSTFSLRLLLIWISQLTHKFSILMGFSTQGLSSITKHQFKTWHRVSTSIPLHMGLINLGLIYRFCFLRNYRHAVTWNTCKG